MITIEFKEPIEVLPSDNYLLVTKDADDTRHFWLPDGTYDGYDKPCDGTWSYSIKEGIENDR